MVDRRSSTDEIPAEYSGIEGGFSNEAPKLAKVRSGVIQALNDNEEVLAAYLYGSSTRSDFSTASDIDVLVVVCDATPLADLIDLTQRVVAAENDIGIDVTVLRQAEVFDGIHPGWSHHYYANVHRGGELLLGEDLIAAPAAVPTSFEGAHRRLVQLCQRFRSVLLNESKGNEEAFWLAKYRHWVPLCLMEFLDLAGYAHAELHYTHDVFATRFIDAPTTTYPYSDGHALQIFLEDITRWLREYSHLFGKGI